jgi:hypothetical protein
LRWRAGWLGSSSSACDEPDDHNHPPRKAYIFPEVKMTAEKQAKKIPWILWPFWAVWKLVELILAATGRLVAVILGLVFLIVGVVLTATVIGAIVGIPFIIFGLLLTLRGLF